MENNQLKNYFENYYVPLKETANERFSIEHSENGRSRNEYQRDYARILYSSSFRRLQGKMQLLDVQEGKFFRNRLTHSLEVAQIARSIAELLKNKIPTLDVYGEDIYVVESGALAHDIGNPPFGHHGEKVLNKLMKEHGGFEGNAQTIRILTKLEKKHPNLKGLNLTGRSLLSTVKYFRPYDHDHQESKFLYNEDYDFFNAKLNDLEIYPRTIDVQIVDLADEIAYCAHDLEDALSSNYFNIEELLFEIKLHCKDNFNILSDWVKSAKCYAYKSTMYNSSEEFAFVFRKELTSIIVDKLARDIDLVQLSEDYKVKTGTKNNEELGFVKYQSLVKSLKKKTFTSVNRTNKVQMYERLGEKVIKGLMEALTDKDFNKDLLLLPVEFRDTNCIHRSVSDYISGMMDKFSINLYTEIYGESSLSNLL
ncbi:dGTP triphosphohydrolase [Bacillus sp. FSL R5-0397]|uniref:deoxyguanosinetriphosphate triphosphohydrolase family protein n=1 Tax=Bacillus TaxID=1386 RepID=UPI00315B238D